MTISNTMHDNKYDVFLIIRADSLLTTPRFSFSGVVEELTK